MPSVYVAGSLNMDVVAFGLKLPAPGETLMGRKVGFFPGGKGLNPAVAAARQGAAVRMIGCLGQDAFGDQLEGFARENGIDLALVQRRAEAASGTAIIMVADGGENSIVVIPGTNGLVDAEQVSAPEYGPSDVLLTMFEIPLPAVKAFLEAGKRDGTRTILSPSPAATFDFLDLPDFLVVNETELGFYGDVEMAGASVEMAVEAAQSLLRGAGQTIVVTLGAAGAVAVSALGVVTVEGRRVEAVDTTGAGDCFVGSLAARLAAADSVEEAMRYANRAASICVTRAGAAPSMPTADEVRALGVR